jgi:aspartyl-tRNA(Asn)/glutamyl-tRNA(Gln) amidotransferase subunit A
MELIDLDVMHMATGLRDREFTAVDVAAAYLTQIERVNGGPPSATGSPDAVNAWVRVYADRALDSAQRADLLRARLGADAPLLAGIPVGLKDLFAVGGLPVTASSDVLADAAPADQDCAAWRRLAGRSMVLLGHTHTHEFAGGATTDQCGNPWSVHRSAGGSSGGSAAAVAAAMVPAALGTDTGGSLRIPAALCGLSTLKPTHGQIPIDGAIPLAHTLDHIGPMARSVVDCAVLYAALLGAGPATPGSPQRVPAARQTARPLAGCRVAMTDRSAEVALDPDVADLLARTADALRDLGAEVIELRRPADASTDEEVARDFRTILYADVWSYHSALADRPDRYQRDVRALLDAARREAPTAESYAQAHRRRAQMASAWQSWMDEQRVDAVLEPSTAITAPPRGQRGTPADGTKVLAALTLLWDMTGQPVVGLPAGLGRRTVLPVGVSLVGRRSGDAELLQLAIDLQHHALPPLPAPPHTV